MKKRIFLLIAILLTSGCAFAAKYKINQNGKITNPNGKVLTSPANTVNQNYYNNYYAPNYVSSNVVNSTNVDTIEIVMDFSGSMANWIGVAKKSMTSIVAQIPQTTKLGFRVFGHDNYGSNPENPITLGQVKKIVKKGNKFTVVTEKNPLGSTKGVCSATEQVSPIIPANSISILKGMNSVSTGGATPLVFALDRAANKDFSQFDTTSPKKIILITDGGENCGGDPCAFAKNLMAKRNDVHIDVVLVSSNSNALSCLSSTTGGHFYNIDNLSDFSNVINKSVNSKPTETLKNQQYFEYVKD